MKVDTYLRTKDLAEAAQISVQQVRNYEANELLPAAERSASGYRRYTRQHLVALKTARSLMAGYGRVLAQQIMQAVHRGKLDHALALIDERHAELAGTRLQAEQTLAALRTLAGQPAARGSTHYNYLRFSQPLRVGEAAKQVGVRVSALHFWEQQGLLQPVRDKISHYRLYDEQQMRRLRVVVLLREAGYDFGAIHTTLDELATGHPEQAIAAVEKRRAELAKTCWACLVAMSAFQGYVSEFWAELCGS